MSDFVEASLAPRDFAYASFPRRGVALVIDSFIVSLVFVALLVTQALTKDINWLGDVDDFGRFIILMGIGELAVFLYPAIFESSRWQATPGKRLLGLRVTRLDGTRVGFFRALARNLGRILSCLPLMLGYFMQLWTARRQTLHDMLSSCLVLGPPPSVAR